jgi:hypothetical protein
MEIHHEEMKNESNLLTKVVHEINADLAQNICFNKSLDMGKVVDKINQVLNLLTTACDKRTTLLRRSPRIDATKQSSTLFVDKQSQSIDNKIVEVCMKFISCKYNCHYGFLGKQPLFLIIPDFRDENYFEWEVHLMQSCFDSIVVRFVYDKCNFPERLKHAEPLIQCFKGMSKICDPLHLDIA